MTGSGRKHIGDVSDLKKSTRLGAFLKVFNTRYNFIDGLIFLSSLNSTPL